MNDSHIDTLEKVCRFLEDTEEIELSSGNKDIQIMRYSYHCAISRYKKLNSLPWAER